MLSHEHILTILTAERQNELRRHSARRRPTTRTPRVRARHRLARRLGL